MSHNEIAVIIIGLIVGYILISKLIPAQIDKNNNEQDPDYKDDSQKKDSNHADDNHGGFHKENKEWNDVLGVDKNSSLDVIKKAYRQKMTEYHPDKVASLGKELRDLAEQKTKEINEAYAAAIKFNQ